jgi:hypothetical protein
VRAFLLAVCAAALVVAGCGGGSEEPDGAARPSELQDLNGVDAFVRAFDESKGSPRLVLLLSPT